MTRNLRHVRKQKRWTTEYTAKQLNISRRMLVAIESGERTPSIKITNKLEDLFKIPQRELLANYTPETVTKGR